MRIVNPVLAFTLSLLLAGCGFQLRGTAALPFDTLYMPPTTSAGVALDLKRNVQSGTRTLVVELERSLVGEGARIEGRGRVTRTLILPHAVCRAPLSDAIVIPSGLVINISNNNRL